MYAGKYQPALDSLGRIVKDYPESSMAPKSRYTMAWIYEHHLANPDSAISQYKALATKHANTKYGEAALRRIPPPVVDTTKKAVADTIKKAAFEPARKSAADTTLKLQTSGTTKMAADTTMKFPPKIPIPADSLLKKVEVQGRPLQKGEPRDSATVRNIEK